MSRRAGLILVFLAALGVRLAYTWHWGQGQKELVADALDYHNYAVSLLDNGTYTNAAGLRASRMPGYPLFLAGVYAVFGRSVTAVQIIQCLLGALTCVLILLLAWDWFGGTLALLAGLSAAFYYDLFSPCARILTETTTTFLLALIFWLWSRRRPLDSSTAFIIGIAAGAAYLIRPELCLFILILAASAAAEGRRRQKKNFWKAPTVLLLAASIFVLPWALRNRQVLGRAVITSTAGPFNFYGWGIARTIEERLGGLPDYYTAPPSLSEVQAMDAYHAVARHFYAHPPIKRIVKAIVFNFIELYYPFLPAYDATFVFFLPFWIFGLWICREDPSRRPLLLLILYASVVYCFAGVMISRHRQILAPAFILLAFSAFKDLPQRLGRRRFALLLGSWAVIGCLIWLGAAPSRQLALAIRNSYSHHQ